MGRRSLAKERRAHIIAVTIQCMATHGFAGTTLEKIAETARMTRGHVRHYVGNRDDLLVDAARVFYFGEQAMDETDLDAAAAAAPFLSSEATMGEALDYLFGAFGAPGQDNRSVTAFVDASHKIPEIREIIVRAYSSIQQSTDAVLSRAYPRVSDERRRLVAYTLMTHAIGTAFLVDVDYRLERLQVARAAAESLIASLEAAQ